MSGLMGKRDDAIRNIIWRCEHASRAAAGSIEAALAKVAKPLATKGFPYRKPTVPRGVVVPKNPSKLGANYETEWARSTPARAGRALITEGPMRLFTKVVASPTVPRGRSPGRFAHPQKIRRR